MNKQLTIVQAALVAIGLGALALSVLNQPKGLQSDGNRQYYVYTTDAESHKIGIANIKIKNGLVTGTLEQKWPKEGNFNLEGKLSPVEQNQGSKGCNSQKHLSISTRSNELAVYDQFEIEQDGEFSLRGSVEYQEMWEQATTVKWNVVLFQVKEDQK